jgi:hypothetical protein
VIRPGVVILRGLLNAEEQVRTIVFGGPERTMFHRVKKVLRGTYYHPHPHHPKFDVRTFRKLDDFTEEDEKAFQTSAYEDRIRRGVRQRITISNKKN